MDSYSSETVLLVCRDEGRAREILAQLYDEGFGVIGPAPTAALALALAAQTAPTVALVAQPPTGRRNAAELASDLMRNWGIRSLVLDEARDGAERSFEGDWSLPAAEMPRLRRALSSFGAPSPMQ